MTHQIRAPIQVAVAVPSLLFHLPSLESCPHSPCCLFFTLTRSHHGYCQSSPRSNVSSYASLPPYQFLTCPPHEAL
ncbi:hypothetical protein EDB89DRAFT_2004713, partial [Lactarius sanguifluus]